MTQAWRTTRGAGVTVAVLGTGVAARHPDLAGDVTTGPDFTGSGRAPDGPFWGIDGTEVASVIAGHGHGPGRQSGIVGVAPAARILSVRVNLEFNDPRNSDQAVARRLPGAIADGITYAVDHGARVIDLPLDPGTFGVAGKENPAAAGGSRAEQAAVAYALRKSVVLVAPAGDDGDGSGLVNYPAAYTGVIAVGAVARSGSLAPFSSRRSYVAVTAPGVALTAATPPASYAPVSSTSAASGIVAGLAALLLSKFPHLTVAQVSQALTKSAVTPGGTAAADNAAGPGTGHGTVDAARAVSLAAQFTSASAPTPTPTAASASASASATPRPSAGAAGAGQAGASAHPADASALARSLVRAVVVGLGVLIVLVVVLILVMRSRRKRTGSGRPGPAGADRPGRNQGPQGARGAQGMRGQHGHRRGDRAPVGGQEATGPSPTIRRPQLAPSGAPGALGGPGAAGWPAPGGWQGGGLGEIAHPPGPPMRPVIAPVPRTTNPLRGGRSTADANPPAPPTPPWAPAPEPDQTSDPFPVASVGSFARPPGSALRVPRDVPRPPAFTARPPGSGTPAVPPVPDNPAVPPDPGTPMASRGSDSPAAAFGFDGPPTSPAASGYIASPAASGDVAGAAALGQFAGTTANPAAAGPGDRPDVTESGTGQDVTEAATDPDMTRITGGAWAAGPAYGPDIPTRRGVDFAAAPVATSYPGTAPPGQDAATGYPGSGPVADPNSIWDLAATDVFPVAAPEPPDDEAPGASKS